MTTTILQDLRTPSKPGPVLAVLAKCPTCDYGRCKRGTNCKACLDANVRSEEARARSRRQELIGHLANLLDCKPTELADALLADLAEGIAEIVAAVLDEREAA